MEWKTAPFSTLYAEPSKNGLNKPQRVRGDGYKMVNMGELFEHERIYDIPMELVPLLEREKSAKLEPLDLLFARQSLVAAGAGQCSIVMETDDLTVYESHLIRVRLDRTKANPLFYFYYFRSSLSPIPTIVLQCAQAGIRAEALGQLNVILPSIEVQKKIASILDAYDRLIENHRRQIALLEEAAQRIYEESFIDQSYDGTQTTLDECIDFNPSVTIPAKQEVPFVPMTALSTHSMCLDTTLYEYRLQPSGSKFQNGDTLLARITPCLENGKTGFAVGFPETGAVGSTEFIVMRSKHSAPHAVYCLARSYLFRQYAINSMAGSDGRQRVQTDKLQAFPVVMPPKSHLENFERTVTPLFEEIHVLERKISLLSEARDRLLPKLLSGEIEV